MTPSKFSITAWKWTLSILVLLSLALLFSEWRYSWAPLLASEHGSLGVALHDQAAAGQAGQNSHKLYVADIEEDSNLYMEGVRENHPLSFVNPLDRWRKFEPGDSVVIRLEDQRHIPLTAIAKPNDARTNLEKAEYVCRMLLSVFALASSLVIGLMGAKYKANRILALTFIALSFNAYYNFNYSEPNPAFTFSKLTSITTNGLIWFGAAWFCLSYRNQAIARIDSTFKPTLKNDVFTLALLLYGLLSCATFFYSLWFGLGYEAPLLWESGMVGVLCAFGIIFGSLFDGWNRTRGEIRERYLWLLGAISIFTLPSVLTWFPQFESAIFLTYLGQAVMYLGMVYAVMNHDVLNFSFAMSRTLILSIITLFMYGLLEFFKYFVELNMKGEIHIGSQDIFIAIVLFVTYQLLHGPIKLFVERWLLRSWYNKEQRLNKFCRDAANFTSIESLLRALVSALGRFTDGATSAIYLLEPDGSYKWKEGSDSFGPTSIPVDDGLLVTLQSEAPGLDMPALRDASLQSALTYELAIPMTHRSLLIGFMVLGSKANYSTYRPDELDVLKTVIRQIGLTVYALKVTILERELLQLQQQVQKDNIAIQLMSGRRKALRDAAQLDGAANG